MRRKPFIGYLTFSISLLILSVFLTKQNGNTLVCLINGFFLAGIPPFLIGLFSYVQKVGFFDIFSYSYKLLRLHSRNSGNDEDGGRSKKTSGENTNKRQESYHEYKQNIEKTPRTMQLEPLFVGILFIGASFLLTLFL